MANRGLKNYYFNEYKRFKYEYIAIPILIAAAIYGIYVGWNAFQASRSPEKAANEIMAALQRKDYAALEKLVQISDDERQRLQFGVTVRTLVEQSLSKMEQHRFRITNFKVGTAKTSRNAATLPVRIQYVTRYSASPRTYDYSLPLIWDQGHWMTTTDAMKEFVPKVSFY